MQMIVCVCVCESLNSSVGIVTGLDGPGIGIRFPAGESFFFSGVPKPVLGLCSPLFNVYRELFLQA